MANRSLFNDATSSKRRMPVDADLDITPMIDVTFLLLIFFMVTSTMQQEAQLQVPPARHGEGIAMDAAIVLTIANRDGEPEIYLGDGVGDSPANLAEVGPYVNEETKAGKNVLVIKADRELPTGFVEEVARAVSETEEVARKLTNDDFRFYVGIQDKPE